MTRQQSAFVPFMPFMQSPRTRSYRILWCASALRRRSRSSAAVRVNEGRVAAAQHNKREGGTWRAALRPHLLRRRGGRKEAAQEVQALRRVAARCAHERAARPQHAPALRRRVVCHAAALQALRRRRGSGARVRGCGRSDTGDPFVG